MGLSLQRPTNNNRVARRVKRISKGISLKYSFRRKSQSRIEFVECKLGIVSII